MYVFDKALPRKPGYELCLHPRFWKGETTGALTQVSCYSPRCPCCAPDYRKREAQILALSFATRSPDYTITLKYHAHSKVRDTELQQHWRAWGEALRYWARKKGWRVTKHRSVEFAAGVAHIHVTMNFDPVPSKAQIDLGGLDLERELHVLWKKAAKKKAANGILYVEPVHTPAAWAKYTTKDLKGDKGDVELPPVGWKGRLTSSSPGFYSKPKAELYDDLKRSWGYEVKPRTKKPKTRKATRHLPRKWVPSDDVVVIGGPVSDHSRDEGLALPVTTFSDESATVEWAMKPTPTLRLDPVMVKRTILSAAGRFRALTGDLSAAPTARPAFRSICPARSLLTAPLRPQPVVRLGSQRCRAAGPAGRTRATATCWTSLWPCGGCTSERRLARRSPRCRSP